MGRPRLACVSVDLDEVGCYHAIHGLAPPAGAAANAIYDHAVERHRSLFDSIGVRATFFAIGRDLEREHNAQLLRSLSKAGHEIANHSWGHRYDLSRCDETTMRDEIERGAAAIERVVGTRPAGFRAPGYTMSDALVRVLDDAGALWDSSVFPCPAYWGAKTAAIGMIALRGRSSRSIADHPFVLSAPADPYRMAAPYWRRGAGLLEMPIGVTRGARLPFIGTSLVMGGPVVSRALATMMVGRPLVVLELHGIDLSDAEPDGLGQLVPHQPDLRWSLSRKLDSVEAALSRLRSSGYTFVTHSEAAEQLRTDRS